MKNPLATTWLISFEQIRHRDFLAADLLSFIACVDPKNVPQSLLLSGPSRKKGTDAIRALHAYSFVNRRLAELALDVHWSVHLATRNWLRIEDLLTQWTERAITRLEEVFPDDEHENRSIWRTYLPHARYALEFDLIDKDKENRLSLVWKFGMCLLHDGRWNEAEVSFAQVMETESRVLDTDHPDTLTSMASLASTFRNQDRWKEAEELEMQVTDF